MGSMVLGGELGGAHWDDFFADAVAGDEGYVEGAFGGHCMRVLARCMCAWNGMVRLGLAFFFLEIGFGGQGHTAFFINASYYCLARIVYHGIAGPARLTRNSTH